MNLEQLFSLDDDVLTLSEERKTFLKKGVHPDLDSIKQESNLHIVGHVADDILFTWDGKKEKSGKEVTLFCLFNLITKKPSVLFDHDRKVDVVTASVNEERTLLAFTVIEFKSLLENPDEETIGTYRCFIAEICPKNRVFSLAVERPIYQRVEFLCGKYPLYAGSARKESHMLFFQHSETIDLYHFPMARIEDGMIMSGQPKVENLVKGFVWAQLDQVNKRLYYVYPTVESTNNFEDKASEAKLIFSAIQFCERFPRVIAVRMLCPFPINSQIYRTSGRFQYDRKSLTNIVAESNVNMQVVSSSNGSLFLCYQHSPRQERTLSQESLLSNEENGEENMESETQQKFLEYSIFMFHHGSILKCKIPNVIPENLIDSARLSFTLLCDCIAVILPGYVFHLLDCDAEHPPCHHLILEAPESLNIQPCNNQLSEFICLNNKDEASINKEELLVFEPSLCKIFKLKIDNKFWTDCFLSTNRDSTRLALLHFSVVHIRDPEVVSEIFSHLVGDPANLECLNILREYLIGSTYFHMKFQVDSSVYKLLPFSNAEPFRGHLEKDKAGKKIARISYSSFKTDDILQNFRDEKRREMEFWISLKRNISHANSVERFSLKRVAISEDGRSTHTRTTEDSGFTSLFRKLRKDTHVAPNLELSPECVPEFLENIRPEPFSKLKEERDSMKVLESLTRYLHHYLPADVPKLKIQNMAMEYTKCQKKQSNNLLQLFWEGLKYTEDTHPYRVPLDIRGSSRDCALFMLLERYHIVVKELRFPFPKGFQTFFVSIGFRCLEPKLFMQYVTNGIFELETEFVHRLLEDVGEDESYRHVISRLISSFEQPKAMRFLSKWNSPHNTSLLCQRYVSQLLTKGSVPLHNDSQDFLSQSQRFDEYEKTVSSFLSSTDCSSEPHTVPFRPLMNVLTALEAAALPAKKTRDAKGTGDGQGSRSKSTLKFIAKHAMQHTANEVDDSLGLVTF